MYHPTLDGLGPGTSVAIYYPSTVTVAVSIAFPLLEPAFFGIHSTLLPVMEKSRAQSFQSTRIEKVQVVEMSKLPTWRLEPISSGGKRPREDVLPVCALCYRDLRVPLRVSLLSHSPSASLQLEPPNVSLTSTHCPLTTLGPALYWFTAPKTPSRLSLSPSPVYTSLLTTRNNAKPTQTEI